MPTSTLIIGRQRARIALAVAAFAALLWTGYEIYQQRELGAALKTPTAPRGIWSLELAPTASRASVIRADWNSRPSALDRSKTATYDTQQVLARDSFLIAAYVARGSLLALWAVWTAGLRWPVAAVLVTVFVAGGLCDVAENGLLANTLVGNPSDEYAPEVRRARLFAMTKFMLLLFGAAATLAAAGGACRMMSGRGKTSVKDDSEEDTRTNRIQSFDDLVKLETDEIFFDTKRRSKDEPYCKIHAAADEQYVAFREADLIGLALSGGGIRSATFNLGLLQGLHRSRLLKLFDYVATVSGGGYVASFWSEWLVRQMKKAEAREWLRYEQLPWVAGALAHVQRGLPQLHSAPLSGAAVQTEHGRHHSATGGCEQVGEPG